MATDTQTARQKLGISRPGEGQQEAAAKPTPLSRAIEALTKAQGVVNGLYDDEQALLGKRSVLGGTLAREGKLSRAQRSELSSVNQQLKKLVTPTKRARAARDRAQAVVDREQRKVDERNRKAREQADARAEAVKERTKAANQRKLDRRIAAAEAKALKRAGAFVQLPEGAKPSRGAGKDAAARPHLTYGYMTKEGRGKGARWVLVVTDSYGMAVLPLQVTGTLPPIKGGVFIPAEALKAIDKTRAFSLTKKGGIQPVKVAERQGQVMYEPEKDADSWNRPYDPTTASGSPREFVVEKVGTGFMVPDEPPTPGGKFVDHTQFVPSKPPAKVNTLEWAFDPVLLKQFAEAIGSGSSDHGNVVVTFDLSKAGKASGGRRVAKPVTIHRHDPNSKRPIEGATAVLMPVQLAERSK